MQKKSGLYIGETGETPIGKLWLAVSDLGLVAIECGLTQAEFEAYLVKRFKRTVEFAPGACPCRRRAVERISLRPAA